ncbi:MAG: Cof-type HAD-IIB family hydrolase [Pseudobdellovibrionaceae bacterium]|nr:Cof-type HAD-IIB family hydrolase [Pseudobdellovibrionaceae bacterium]
MMHPYKAVFIDLDGTLLNRQAQVSERNNACLKKLVAQGVHIVIATGRPVESIRRLVAQIQSPSPVISLSGSMVHKSLFGEPLAAQIIPFETMHSLLEVCRGLGGVKNILLDEAEGFYALQDDPVIDEFIGMYGKKPNMFTYDNVPQGPVLSILVHAREDRRAIYETLQDQFGDLVHFTYFREYPWIELSAFEANKGQAMSIVCQHLGIALEETIAIGDGANDLEMIAAAGLGIAMENGDDEVKAVADRVAPHHTQDGVAQILEEIFQLKS